MTNARLVILFLGVIILVATGGIIYLSSADKGIPDVLVALATGGLGALGAVLARTSENSPVNVEGPSTVEVDARPDRGVIDVGTAIVIAAALLCLVLLINAGVFR